MVALRIQITPDPKTVAQKFQRLKAEGVYASLARYTPSAARLILDALVVQAPMRTGQYAEAHHMIQLASGGNLTLQFRAPNPLATWIINGTPPHSIDAKPGSVLSFLGSSGDVVFARHVDHPGTQPNNYPSRAWDEVAGSVAEIFLPLGKDIIRELT